MKRNIKITVLVILAALSFCACGHQEEFFSMRGAVLSVEDLVTADWPRIAHENGINTLGTHITPDQVLRFWESEKGRKFQDDCQKYGILMEHELHAMSALLPREYFAEDSTMFRMDENGRRTADFNCCASSTRALDTIASRALYYASHLTSTNHRYYFWLDDGAPVCHCPQCAGLTASEQALIIENRMLEAIRSHDPEAMLAHLAYYSTLQAPRKVKPHDGVCPFPASTGQTYHRLHCRGTQYWKQCQKPGLSKGEPGSVSSRNSSGAGLLAGCFDGQRMEEARSGTALERGCLSRGHCHLCKFGHSQHHDFCRLYGFHLLQGLSPPCLPEGIWGCAKDVRRKQRGPLMDFQDQIFQYGCKPKGVHTQHEEHHQEALSRVQSC